MEVMNKLLRVVGIIVFVLSLVGLVLWWQKPSIGAEPTRYPVFLRQIDSIPVLSDLETSSPESATIAATPKASDLSITAQAAYIADLDSGAVLYKKNEHIQLAPAATPKLITALVALDTYSLDDVLTVESETNTAGNVIGFFRGEQLTVRSLLMAMLISSGNDAAYVIANNHPDGFEAFIEAMNQKAAEIGMQSSHFENPAGFDAETQ